jgi:hypothetical protein
MPKPELGTFKCDLCRKGIAGIEGCRRARGVLRERSRSWPEEAASSTCRILKQPALGDRGLAVPAAAQITPSARSFAMAFGVIPPSDFKMRSLCSPSRGGGADGDPGVAPRRIGMPMTRISFAVG